MNGIDTTRIQSMLAQIHAAAARMEAQSKPSLVEQGGAEKSDFSTALKASLESVNAAQNQAQELGRQFAMGDERVGLSEVMVSMQKANIAFQTTVQVRNKLVSAYHDIMNMQI